ncbi:hypothetical protein DL770_007919 [Monosporascus sp. CRB-9-2]|nr:hypothetical protein DL770_007919 [Monosporascus sp. CRB-9-2]
MPRNDAPERTAQVQKMRHIYHQADVARDAGGGFNVTDCRDRLYTLVGISTDDWEIVPDHSKTGEAVFVDYAKLDVTKDQISRCPLGGRIMPSNDPGPSWIPELRREVARELAWAYDPDNRNKLRPSGDSKPYRNATATSTVRHHTIYRPPPAALARPAGPPRRGLLTHARHGPGVLHVVPGPDDPGPAHFGGPSSRSPSGSSPSPTPSKPPVRTSASPRSSTAAP